MSIAVSKCGKLVTNNGEVHMLPGGKSGGIESHGPIPCATSGSFHRTASPCRRDPAPYSLRCQPDELASRMLNSKRSFVSWSSLCL